MVNELYPRHRLRKPVHSGFSGSVSEAAGKSGDVIKRARREPRAQI